MAYNTFSDNSELPVILKDAVLNSLISEYFYVFDPCITRLLFFRILGDKILIMFLSLYFICQRICYLTTD